MKKKTRAKSYDDFMTTLSTKNLPKKKKTKENASCNLQYASDFFFHLIVIRTFNAYGALARFSNGA